MRQTDTAMHTRDLFNLCEDVTNEATFLIFVTALKRHRVDVDTGVLPDNWENDSIAAFLGGAISWAEDSEFGRSQGLRADNPWKQFAVFLYCGKIYE
jgi:hypothetical protein